MKLNKKSTAYYIVCMAIVLMISAIFLVNKNKSTLLAMKNIKADYIKWVDFNIPYEALEKALDVDIQRHKEGKDLSWVDILAYLGTKYGGNWKLYKNKDIIELLEKIDKNQTIEELMKDNSYYPYYKQAYGAVLDGFVGEYKKEVPDKQQEGEKKIEEKYGLQVYLPIAEGFGFSHYKDFMNARNYGYNRKHLGHDMMGTVGTPIVAIEGGKIENIGWNQYGGWRISIRSFDKKRSYYYAHLRKDKPYQSGLKPGDVVKPGQVIGYLGMTGYSTKENTNNMKAPHLHVGMQLIFDESQKEGTNQIWINLYDITRLLYKNKATVEKDVDSGEYYRKYDIFDDNYDN